MVEDDGGHQREHAGLEADQDGHQADDTDPPQHRLEPRQPRRGQIAQTMGLGHGLPDDRLGGADAGGVARQHHPQRLSRNDDARRRQGGWRGRQLSLPPRGQDHRAVSANRSRRSMTSRPSITLQ